METIDNNPKQSPFSIFNICNGYDLTRDAFYKYKKRFVKRIKIENQVLEIVHKRRRTLPREGARKLMHSLKMDFEKHNIKIGRDQLYQLYFIVSLIFRIFPYVNDIKNRVSRP